MPVQPQLVLLQKTLLNIEGLGRQLYPELNLWDTAHPFLEKWIEQRYHPKTLWKELKYYAPEWLEKLPELPHLLVEALEKRPTTENVNSALVTQNKPSHSKRRIIKTTATIVFALGLGLSYYDEQLDLEDASLLVSALLLFLIA